MNHIAKDRTLVLRDTTPIGLVTDASSRYWSHALFGAPIGLGILGLFGSEVGGFHPINLLVGLVVTTAALVAWRRYFTRNRAIDELRSHPVPWTAYLRVLGVSLTLAIPLFATALVENNQSRALKFIGGVSTDLGTLTSPELIVRQAPAGSHWQVQMSIHNTTNSSLDIQHVSLIGDGALTLPQVVGVQIAPPGPFSAQSDSLQPSSLEGKHLLNPGATMGLSVDIGLPRAGTASGFSGLMVTYRRGIFTYQSALYGLGALFCTHELVVAPDLRSCISQSTALLPELSAQYTRATAPLSPLGLLTLLLLTNPLHHRL